MAKKNDTEEKTLPPSKRKLEEARKKGQVEKSKDMVSAVVMLAGCVYLSLAAHTFYLHIMALWEVAGEAARTPFWVLWPRVESLFVYTLLSALLPLIVATLMVSALTNIIIMKGVVFAAEPIKPNAEHINPVEGFKRLFSVRSLIELIKSLCKLLLLGVSFVVIFLLSLQRLVDMPQCGVGCIGTEFTSMIEAVAIAALIAFFIVGALDVGLQRWLFRRDQRMSKTEMKRERKDMEGDPEIIKQRRKIRHDLSLSNRVKATDSSMLIGKPGEWLVGICYIKGQTQVPLVAAKASPETSLALYTELQPLGLPLVNDSGMARRIAIASAKGDPIPDNTFQEVATLLVRAHLA